MDKIFYCGGVEVRNLERIRVGVRIEEAKMKSYGVLDFVTGHYGLMADAIIVPRHLAWIQSLRCLMED